MDYSNKTPETGQLKQQIVILTVLEATMPRSRFQQGLGSDGRLPSWLAVSDLIAVFPGLFP